MHYFCSIVAQNFENDDRDGFWMISDLKIISFDFNL